MLDYNSQIMKMQQLDVILCVAKIVNNFITQMYC